MVLKEVLEVLHQQEGVIVSLQQPLKLLQVLYGPLEPCEGGEVLNPTRGEYQPLKGGRSSLV